MANTELVRWFDTLGRQDVGIVGGKNASLGEMITRLGEAGIRVPGGFATTAAAYWLFLDADGLREAIARELANLQHDASNLAIVGSAVRKRILEAKMPAV